MSTKDPHSIVINLTPNDIPGFCNPGERFYQVHCQCCNITFGNKSLDGSMTSVPSKRKPMYHCRNAVERCSYALCYGCYAEKTEEYLKSNEGKKRHRTTNNKTST
jgi:hypothetical protein